MSGKKGQMPIAHVFLEPEVSGQQLKNSKGVPFNTRDSKKKKLLKSSHQKR